MEVIFSQFRDFSYRPPQESQNNQFTTEKLEAFRHQIDEIGQQCYDRLKKEFRDRGESSFPKEFDIIEEIKRRATDDSEENEIYKQFYNETFIVPNWVDFDRVENGKKVITRATIPAGVFALTAGSLVQSYAGADGAEVLVATGRLKDDVIKRILETGYFLYLVVSPGSLAPGCKGHKTILQVRMLHCAVRNFLLSRMKEWNSQLGLPINQEDLAGTLCVFGVVFAEAHAKLGYLVTEQEKEDLHHLWRYIGYLLGVDDELLTKNYQESVDIAHSIFRHQCKPKDTSQALVNQLFESIHLSPFFFFFPTPFWHQLSRFLIDDELADKLGVRKRSENWLTVVRFFTLLIKLQYLVHQIPYVLSIDQFFKKKFWDAFMYIGLEGRSVDYKMKRY